MFAPKYRLLGNPQADTPEGQTVFLPLNNNSRKAIRCTIASGFLCRFKTDVGMGINIKIINDGEGIEIIATGKVTGKEIITAHGQIYLSDHLKKQKYHIIDKSKCTEYNVTAEEIQRIAGLDIAAAKINPSIIVAVIESETLRFSLTELWQAQVANSVLKTKSFIQRESAMQWIAENLA